MDDFESRQLDDIRSAVESTTFELQNVAGLLASIEHKLDYTEGCIASAGYALWLLVGIVALIALRHYDVL